MKKFAMAAAALVLGAFYAGAQELPELPDVPQVPVSMSVTYYEIEGRRYRDAVSAMRTAGPIGYEAETRTWFRFYYEVSQASNGCSITFLELPLDVEILYPRWNGYDRSRRSERERWDGHMHVLTVHENVHALIAFLGAIETYNDIVRMGPQADCEVLRSTVSATVDTANARIQTWQRDYDRVTDHGVEQVDFDLNAFMSERL